MISTLSITVSDDELTDLRVRLRGSRFTPATGFEPWTHGVDPDYLRNLTEYWADGFDWRAAEARLNSLPHFVAEVSGSKMHFVHLRAEANDHGLALPILLAHGWPSSFVEMLELGDRLAHPSRHGLSGEAAYDVVIPSLPGFLFSELPTSPLTRAVIGDSFHELMTEALGYPRYGLFGGDIGGVSAATTASRHADAVTGILQIHPSFPASLEAAPLTEEEQRFLEREARYDETDGGYSAIMMTRPDTIAAALIDSPVGLAAWIVDKYRDWSDCGGDVETRFDRDTLLTILTLYWVTGTIGTSFRQYVDYPHNEPRGVIEVPAAFTLSTEPGMTGFPRSLAERAYADIRSWHTPGRGGHFLAHEEPELAASEIRAFFATLP